jgi:hypothetical protein
MIAPNCRLLIERPPERGGDRAIAELAADVR